MIDLDAVDEGYLAKWARARISADAELIESELDHIIAGIACDVGLNAEVGAVMYLDRNAGSVYTIAPGDVIGQKVDGRHVALRHGGEVIPTNRRDAAPMN